MSSCCTSRMAVFLLLVTTLLAVQCAATVDPECGVPPSMWCSSPAVAKACQVEESCERYLKAANASAAPQVKLTLYYESLCPGCQKFIYGHLFSTWKQLSPTGIMELELVPYGNARESKDYRSGEWMFTCQHGPEECIGNQIETCALDKLNYDMSAAVPYISCIEGSLHAGAKSAAEQCANKTKVNFAEIWKCANGKQGNALEHKMAVKTDSLRPRHQYVPWITINGVHLQHELTTNLLDYVCAAYTGTKPAACSKESNVSPATVCARD